MRLIWGDKEAEYFCGEGLTRFRKIRSDLRAVLLCLVGWVELFAKPIVANAEYLMAFARAQSVLRAELIRATLSCLIGVENARPVRLGWKLLSGCHGSGTGKVNR
jgi:hypothetical protein